MKQQFIQIQIIIMLPSCFINIWHESVFVLANLGLENCLQSDQCNEIHKRHPAKLIKLSFLQCILYVAKTNLSDY